MEGVDREDENIVKMRANIRGKKWYLHLLSVPLNVSVNNAWQIHRWSRRSKAEQLDLLGSTRQICLIYSKCFHRSTGTSFFHYFSICHKK